MKFECRVNGIEKLRLPGMHRVKAQCNDANIVFETYENIALFKPEDKVDITITDSKEKCMEHDICGQGYIVSNKKIENEYRVVISLHGPLIVIYTDKKLKGSLFNTMNKVYVGISKTSP